MELTGLWDIKSSKGYIYAAFKNHRSDEGISGDETGSEANIGFLPWNAFSEGSIFKLSDTAI